jgi:putative ABC transport system permease protein
VRVGFDQATNQIRWGEIVGVVAHINHYGIDQVKEYGLKFEGREQVYFPVDQVTPQQMYVAIRTSTDPESLVSAVRAQVLALDPDQPIYQVKTMDQLFATSVSQRRLNMFLFAGFSAVALILAAVGIYGVLSYSVTQRTHEIGIRMALGAKQASVLSLVVRQGMTLVGVGLAAGVGAAIALTRLMQSLLFEVSPTDPITLATMSLTLAAVALFACLIPARRAARVDPMVALRYE